MSAADRERDMLARAEHLIREASLSPAEAAAALGITEASLRTAIARGSLPVERLLPDHHRITRVRRSVVADRKDDTKC